jgi:hypothetical protein
LRWGLRHCHLALFKSFSIFCKFSCSNLLYIFFPEVYPPGLSWFHYAMVPPPSDKS